VIEAMLLGVAQDAGVPQIGCECATCAQARLDSARRQPVVSLGLIDHDARMFWVVDATPDFRDQYDRVRVSAPACAFGGVLLTHAHVGHYTGLIHLGREAMNARGAAAYATPAMCDFLAANAPWSQLVALNNIAPVPIAPLNWQDAGDHAGRQLSSGLRVVPIRVPHRNEFSDVVAWLVDGPARRLLFLPDIDSWEAWTDDLQATLRALRVNIALLDGSFFSRDELPRFAQVPHPLVTDTAERLGGAFAAATEVHIVHLNHSNPLWRDGAERAWLHGHGLRTGVNGASWVL
jgi:pyrroloquinoline quinone biosynthesis protein B